MNRFPLLSDSALCYAATNDGRWETRNAYLSQVMEAKRRGLDCGVGESVSTQAASTTTSSLPACPSNQDAIWHNCFGTGVYGDNYYVGDYKNNLANGQGTYTFADGDKYVGASRDGKYNGQGTLTFADGRAAMEGVWKDNKLQYSKRLTPSTSTAADKVIEALTARNSKEENDSTDNSNVSSAELKAVQTSAELTAAQQKAEEERRKRLELEQELAALKAKQEEQQATILADSQIPLIEVASQQKDEATALVYGRAKDNVGVADVLVNNEPVQIGSDGSFQTQLYIPPNGVVVEITAYDLKGNKASKTLSLNRSEAKDAAETRFAQLQPSLGKRGAINRNAIALIVGVEKYENLPAAPAIHADKDAEYFADFAHYKLGIPRNNIIKAINSDAKRLDILKAITKVTKLSTKDETEVFIFFAGHGLAADDGEDVVGDVGGRFEHRDHHLGQK